MKIEGQRTFPASAEVMWILLNDPVTLKLVLPGCDSFEAAGPGEYRYSLSFRIGREIEHFTGEIRQNHAVPYRGLDFLASGLILDGAIVSRGHINLEEMDGETTVGYKAEIEVNGRLASISPRMLETTARSFARRTLDGLEKQIGIRTRVYTTSTTGDESVKVTPAVISIGQMARLRRVLAIFAVVLAVVLLWRDISRKRTRGNADRVVDMPSPSAANSPAGAVGRGAA